MVIQTSFLGDMVLTTPLLAELAKRGPVDVVARPDAAALLANHPAVRRVIVYDKRGAARGFGGLLRIAREVRGVDGSAAPRVAYLAQGSARSGALALLAGMTERVGFATSAGRWFYTHRVPYRNDRHHAERLWRLAMPNDAEPAIDALRPRLYPGATDVAAVDALLAGGGVERDEPFIALAPGSVWATKRWPSYPALATLLSGRHRVVVIGGGDDAPLAREIGEAMRAAGAPPVVDATGRLSLLASAELIRRAAALVTNDSAPQHLASAMATPTVTIFGPTVPEFGFGPLAPRHAIAGVDALECRPCDAHGPNRCPLGHWRCMRDLSPDALEQLVRRLT